MKSTSNLKENIVAIIIFAAYEKRIFKQCFYASEYNFFSDTYYGTSEKWNGNFVIYDIPICHYFNDYVLYSCSEIYDCNCMYPGDSIRFEKFSSV